MTREQALQDKIMVTLKVKMNQKRVHPIFKEIFEPIVKDTLEEVFRVDQENLSKVQQS